MPMSVSMVSTATLAGFARFTEYGASARIALSNGLHVFDRFMKHENGGAKTR